MIMSMNGEQRAQETASMNIQQGTEQRSCRGFGWRKHRARLKSLCCVCFGRVFCLCGYACGQSPLECVLKSRLLAIYHIIKR